MNVLFFSTAFPQPDDLAQSPYNLHRCEALARLGLGVEVMSPFGWHRLRRAPQERHSSRVGTLLVDRPLFLYPPGVWHGSHAWFMWHSVRRAAARAVGRFRPDVVLSYWTYPDAAVALRIARRAGLPCVTMVGGSDVLSIDSANPNAAAKRVTRVLDAVDAIVTVGEHLKHRICALGVPQGKVHVLPAGVDSHMFSPGIQQAARVDLGLPQDAYVLVWVGRMVEVKALDVLLTSVRNVARTNPRLRLYLLGDGKLRTVLESQVRDFGLSEQVVFVGRVAQDRLPDWYRAANCAVLPSHWEGTPNVLLEAHACGTPFVATNVGSIPQLAVDGIDRLVPPADPDALSRALSEMMQRPAPVAGVALKATGWDEAGSTLARVLTDVCRQPARQEAASGGSEGRAQSSRVELC